MFIFVAFCLISLLFIIIQSHVGDVFGVTIKPSVPINSTTSINKVNNNNNSSYFYNNSNKTNNINNSNNSSINNNSNASDRGTTTSTSKDTNKHTSSTTPIEYNVYPVYSNPDPVYTKSNTVNIPDPVYTKSVPISTNTDSIDESNLTPINDNNTTPQLPDGWEQGTAPDGSIYYYHRLTRVSRWELPTKDVVNAVDDRYQQSQLKMNNAVKKRINDIENEKKLKSENEYQILLSQVLIIML